MLLVKQVKGHVKTSRRQVETLKGLGLRRIGAEVQLKDTPSVRGMLKRVAHLVTWESLKKS